MHPDLVRIIEQDRAAIAQGYTEGDVNHNVQPIIGLLRLRLQDGRPVTKGEMEHAVAALLRATQAEIALLAYLHPEKYAHALPPGAPQ